MCGSKLRKQEESLPLPVLIRSPLNIIEAIYYGPDIMAQIKDRQGLKFSDFNSARIVTVSVMFP
jgi:hypothetical protein